MPVEERDEVENVREFMTILMEVKVSMADLNRKVENIIDIKEKVEKTHVMSQETHMKATQNEKDISDLEKDVRYLKNNLAVEIDRKASKEDIERIIKDREDWWKNAPVWITALLAITTVLMQFI